MQWTPSALASALRNSADLNISIENNESSFVITMHDHGDLKINVLLTSRQIILETFICPLDSIQDQATFNLFLLRNQKLLPLSSVGICRLQQQEYYIAFGALSLGSSLEDIVLELTTLVENALDIAEITQEYMQAQ
ncbi:YjfI family protein [Serratia microhaemolytica]|uniref:YjfI family protein n=1 Tax=Serratia microhaemolytica TaxID=2675110 RepID=UPI000FDEE7CA|nr:DUF2170 family protein [Serratia microhaemolytica]